jgi:hypothetical protein
MKRVLVIDVVKEFPFPPDTEVVYARTLQDGFDQLWEVFRLPLIDSPSEFELWLDHDLGGEDTIRPLVLQLAEMAYYGVTYPFSRIVICSLNIVGIEWIESTLWPPYHTVRCTSPEQLNTLIGISVAKWY